MKKLRIFALISIFAFISADSYGAGWFQEWRSERQQRQVGQKKMQQQQGKALGQNPGGQQTGAPIDGGLLALLAAGGIAIYGTKKKKKSIEN